ncbi:MAG: hypothetical protein GTN65_14270, partial [Armatimonadetes bacterium]|nr:hypothetical protein [Armatimonadota bacterium]NIO98226.1 hypothetical protein [Armatimonadota bacterium]
MNAEEKEYLSSLKSIVLVDPNDIKVLAKEVASAEYLGVDPKPLRAAEYVQITGYVDSKPKVSFIIWATELRLKDGPVFHIFRNNRFSLCLEELRPQVQPFEWRMYCALRLQSLHRRMRDAADRGGIYPTPFQWCDAIEQYLRALNHPENSIKWAFSCPSVREGRCNYAMNWDRRLGSPPDTVLLFEAKPGWNQHGGP